eukprot:758799-Hanusia_phi.AAC.2
MEFLHAIMRASHTHTGSDPGSPNDAIFFKWTPIVESLCAYLDPFSLHCTFFFPRGCYSVSAPRLGAEVCTRVGVGNLMSFSPFVQVVSGHPGGRGILARVYPIVFICGLATTFCGITISKRFGMHENVTWSKSARNMGVATQYAHKYPGTESAVVAGLQK